MYGMLGICIADRPMGEALLTDPLLLGWEVGWGSHVMGVVVVGGGGGGGGGGGLNRHNYTTQLL